MQAKFFIGSLLLVTKVLAGGFAGALERVWLFYAYQIDGLNDPADRILGWKCRSWDDVAKKCRINKRTGKESWEECKGSMEGRRCTFSQLLNHMDGLTNPKDQLAADEHGNPLDSKATDLDPEETAKKVYAHYLASPKHKVTDWRPWSILDKATHDFAETVNKVGDVVAKAAADGKNTGDNKKLFERFTETTAQIKKARVGDHGRWLIAAAEQDLKPKGINVEIEKVDPGYNPGDPSQPWETVDWEKTMSGPVASGKYSEVQMLVITDGTREGYYDRDGDAAKHRVVIQSFEIVENKAKGCI